MGFRMRKSINLGGGARVNLSKSGVGFSVGTKGARLTKTANGSTRTTFSVPGTGLSYSTEHSGHKSVAHTNHGAENSCPPPNGPKKPHSVKTIIQWVLAVWFFLSFAAFVPHLCSWIMLLTGLLLAPIKPLQKRIQQYISPKIKIVLVVVLFFLACAAVPESSPEKESSEPVTETIAASTEEAAVEAIETMAADETAETSSEPATEIPSENTEASTVEEITEAATTPAVKEMTEASAAPDAEAGTEAVEDNMNFTESPIEDVGQDYVINTNSGKFHFPSCSSAKKIKPSNRRDYCGSREDLINQGYSPCGRCHP